MNIPNACPASFELRAGLHECDAAAYDAKNKHAPRDCKIEGRGSCEDRARRCTICGIMDELFITVSFYLPLPGEANVARRGKYKRNKHRAESSGQLQNQTKGTSVAPRL